MTSNMNRREDRCSECEGWQRGTAWASVSAQLPEKDEDPVRLERVDLQRKTYYYDSTVTVGLRENQQ